MDYNPYEFHFQRITARLNRLEVQVEKNRDEWEKRMRAVEIWQASTSVKIAVIVFLAALVASAFGVAVRDFVANLLG